MQDSGKKAAAVIAVLMAVGVTVLRVVLVTQAETAWFQYGMIGLLVVTMLVMAVLVNKKREPLPAVGGVFLIPGAVLSMLCGSVMLVTTIYDGWMWLSKGKTPPPNDRILGNVDAFMLACAIVFGILGGVFLIQLGLQWVSDNGSVAGRFRLMALAPVLWVWMRLARYEMSYASAVSIGQSFYDFMMLIVMLLFFFAFARYVSGVGARSPKQLLTFALCTGLLSISGPLTRFGLYLTNELDGVLASQLAGPTDLCIGIFALYLAFALAFAYPQEEQPAADETETAAEEPAVLVDSDRTE